MEEELPAEVVAHWAAKKREFAFVERLQGAEQHWFFIQGLQCLEHGLHLPAASCILNGLEATLRIYVQRFSDPRPDWSLEPSPYRVLSNPLIVQARALGLSVECLAFPGEDDFDDKLNSAKPNRRDVEVVSLRNQLCHGNLWSFINKDLGEKNAIFVPNVLERVVEQLIVISENWAVELQKFRNERT